MEGYTQYKPEETTDQTNSFLDFEGRRRHKNPFKRKIVGFSGAVIKRFRSVASELQPPNFENLKKQKKLKKEINQAAKKW